MAGTRDPIQQPSMGTKGESDSLRSAHLRCSGSKRVAVDFICQDWASRGYSVKYHAPRFDCNSSLGQGRRQGRSRVGCAERGRSLFGRQDGCRRECRRMESVERTHTSLIGPGRSHSRPASFSYHGGPVVQVVAGDRVRELGAPEGSRQWRIRSLEVGWPSSVARRHRRSEVALGKLHKLPLGQGAGRSERDSQWKRAWQAAVKCSKSISSLPRQAAQAWRCHW